MTNPHFRRSIEETRDTEIRPVNTMEPKTVEKLEEKIEEAIAEIMAKLGRKKLPFEPSPLTVHLMAKAAVTVYEAAVENYRPK